MKTVIPGASIIPITHSRNKTESVPVQTRPSRSRDMVRPLLQASRQLTLRHVQLMQSKLRFKDSLSAGACSYRRRSGVDECCAAMCDDPLYSCIKERAEAHEDDSYRWELPSRSVTPAPRPVTLPVKVTPTSDAERAPTRNIRTRHPFRKLQPVSAPLSRKARDAGRILAPLSRCVYPDKFVMKRRRQSASRFTLEDFYVLEHSRNHTVELV